MAKQKKLAYYPPAFYDLTHLVALRGETREMKFPSSAEAISFRGSYWAWVSALRAKVEADKRLSTLKHQKIELDPVQQYDADTALYTTQVHLKVKDDGTLIVMPRDQTDLHKIARDLVNSTPGTTQNEDILKSQQELIRKLEAAGLPQSRAVGAPPLPNKDKKLDGE